MKPGHRFTRGVPSGAEGLNGVRRDREQPPVPIEHVQDLVRSGSAYELSRLLNAKGHGIDVNAASSKTGKRLLHDAFEHHVGSPYAKSDVVKLLLEHGADPNLKDNQGKTPLDAATHSAKPNPPAIALLLNAGAQVSDAAMERGVALRSGDARWMYFMLCDAPRLK